MNGADEAVDTLVVGHVTRDRLDTGVFPGGTAYYAALTHAAFGSRVLLNTRADPSFDVAEVLAQTVAGIEVHVTPDEVTTEFENRYDASGQRTQWVHAVAGSVAPSHQLPAVDVLHLAPVLGEVDPTVWIDAVDARVVTLSVQGWLRRLVPQTSSTAAQVVRAAWAPASELLSRVHLVVLSREEAGVDGLLARLRDHVETVVVTDAEHGCRVFSSGKTSHVGIYPARVVDPTGAGDTFAATMAHGLARGLDAPVAAQLGAAAASISIEATGAAALRRLREAEARATSIVITSE